MSYGGKRGRGYSYGNQRRSHFTGSYRGKPKSTHDLILKAFKELPEDLLDHSKQVYVIDDDVYKRTKIPSSIANHAPVNIHNHFSAQPPNYGDIDALRKGLLKGNMRKIVVIASETGEFFAVEPILENSDENRANLIAFLKLDEGRIKQEFETFGWDLSEGDSDPRQLKALKQFADKYGLKVETGKVKEIEGIVAP